MSYSLLTREAAAAILAFYVDSGVDIALDETIHNRLEPDVAGINAASVQPDSPVERQQLSAASAWSIVRPALFAPALPTAAPRPASMAIAPDAAALAARESAGAATTLEELRAVYLAFEGCALKATAKNMCFADGNPEARIMLVGEAPGADEDRVGLPFVGRSGQLLDKMLGAIGLDRKSVYIANTVPWRPPGNRAPTSQEMAICLPFIQRQIALCNPDILVCLGGPSMQSLLGVKEGVLRTRGRWFEYEIRDASGIATRSIKALATLHPAYLLRQPLQKRQAWQDFRALREAISGQ